MSFYMYSANWYGLSKTFSDNKIFEKLNEVDPAFSKKNQAQLAGPNDNLQLIMDRAELAIAVASFIGKDNIKAFIKENLNLNKVRFANLAMLILHVADVISPGVYFIFGMNIE